MNSIYNEVSSSINISWTPPPAITIPPASRPERFYCTQIVTGTETISRGCNRSEEINEDISFVLSNIMCGVNYNITVIPFNRLGDGAARLVELPGMEIVYNHYDATLIEDLTNGLFLISLFIDVRLSID